ncbi:DUF1801 domain-containing protein [Dyadobacter sp. CY323]|uniref:DUF1801 domain-containing protein n=1 Tax=Dyadobacter sp. CY323 TaxID=2907302 RepID=UPI001F2BE178|nr:DUF1801 domain-containing protein [Dyadobacter sp. CY323]MCE6988750.1 DUF1801 domain-containing protein [Dyadobacter sp. CY323]
MAQNKTTETTGSVTDFINAVPNEIKRRDSFEIIEMMRKCTGKEPKMWGPGIVGFGSYHYKYESGHEGDAPLIGFSPRSNAITLYMATNFTSKEELLAKFGKHTLGKGCVYIKKLSDVDKGVLEEMIADSFEYMQDKYLNQARF